MNQRGVDVLVAAALAGRPQARHRLIDGPARCAMGYLCEALGFNSADKPYAVIIDRSYALRDELLCPAQDQDAPHVDCHTPLTEGHLIMHLNDWHQWDLLKIARTLGTPE